MAKMSYPELEAHKKSHRVFLERLNEIKRQQEAGQDTSVDFLEYMAKWLREHTMKYDKLYVTYMNEHS
jgi:methyl-accepting chemotaxis protein/hemerythrin